MSESSNAPDSIGKPVYLPPGVRPGELPPFYLLGEYVFQDLCRDLLDADPDVAYCDVYGRRGQRQHGIDLRAPLNRNAGHDVGQCKCYEKFTIADIRAASDEFLKHWSRWAGLGIRRFILFVACDLSDRQLQDELVIQGDRFKALGLEYAAWSAAKIRNLLRPHRGLVASYFKPSEVWVREICGPDAPPEFSATSTRAADLQTAATLALLEQLAERLSGNTSQQLEALRDAWREGRSADALSGVTALKLDQPVWSVLNAEAKARVLRFEASLILDSPDGLSRARELAAEARRLAPADDHSRIDALIAHRTDGASAALKALGEPVDSDARHLAAILLLEQGLPGEGLDLLDAERHGFTATADTFRLQALAYASARDFERARLAAQRALELAPRWESVCSAAGAVEYLSSLSPGVRPNTIPSWPFPPGWSFVRRDDESIARLRTAAERFRSLSLPSRKTVVDREIYETWHLACIANDPERQDEAALRTRQLLEERPTHPGAVAWALGRSYDIDQARVEQALETRINTEPEEIQSVISLVMCLLIRERSMDAVKLLLRMRQRFEAQGQKQWWGFWYGQVILAAGQEEDLEFMNLVDAEDRRQLELLALRLRAERTGEWELLATALDSEHKQTDHAPYLFEACVAWMRVKDWAAVVERADLLVSTVGTSEAVHLAVVAAQNARRPELVVRLLDDNRELFPNGKLPRELRVMRTRALYAQGELSQAVAEARELARDEPVLSNQFRLAQLLSMKGELSELTALIRNIAMREDLVAADAMRLARTIAIDDAELAIQLWRRANRWGIADEMVGSALELAYRLGLEGETGSLMERMDHLAREGLHGHQIFPTSELPGFAATWSHERAQAMEAYHAGMLPVHLFAKRLGVPLAALYRHNLADHERNPRPANQFALCVQHGMRALTTGPSQGRLQGRLHADITALLLAAHLRVLERVERAFGPIWIPDDLIFDLVRMRDELVPKQPSRLKHAQQVVKLAAAGKIAVSSFTEEAQTSRFPWQEELGDERSSMLAHAVVKDGCLLDFFPLRSISNAPLPILPDEISRRFVSPRAVVNALRQYGPLSRTEHRRALRELGAEREGSPQSDLPRPDQPLYCHANTAEVLASVGVLDHACDRFRVEVDASMLRELRAEHDFYEDRSDEVRWLSALIEHLSVGESEGRYRIIPPSVNDSGDEVGVGFGESHGFRTLLTFTAQPGDAVWIDDRWATGHWRRDNASVIGTIQVLQSMLRDSVLSRSDYYDALTRLRAANVRYIPISAGEIVYHIHDAELDERGIVETYGLKVLRRYTAAWLLEARWLGRPFRDNGTPNPKSEMAVLAGLTQAVAKALQNLIMRGNTDRRTRSARAKWVMENLYVDHATIGHHAELASPTDDLTRLAAVSALEIIIQGISFGWNKGAKGRKLRRRYMAWVWRYILRTRSDADRLFLPLIAEYLKNTHMFQFSDNDLPHESRIAARRLIYNDLPRRLRDELAKDPEFQARLGIETIPVVSVEGIDIERTAFISGAVAAVNGRPKTEVLAGSDQVVHFEPVNLSTTSRFRITGAFDGGEIYLNEEIFGVLNESPAEREAVLRRNPEWFDGPAGAFEDWIATIASTEDPVRRFLEVEMGRDTSPTRHYWKLVQRLRTTKSYRWQDLKPPPLERLLRYFRVESIDSTGRHFRRALAAQADLLIAEVGLEEALERWSGLPVPLPPAFSSAVAQLDPVERRKLVGRLLRLAGSPVSDLHLVRLLWTFRNTDRSFGRLAQIRARRLLSSPDEASRFTTFGAMLAWVGEEFALRADAADLPVQFRLALVWMHTHRLFAAFTASGADMTRLGQHFRSTRHRLSSREIFDDPSYQYDAAAPARLERLPFLLGGLLYAFAGTRAGEVGDALSQTVEGTLFLNVEGTRVPDVRLLRDTSLAKNALGSFMHRKRERALRAILRPEHATVLASTALRTMMSEAMSATHSDSDAPAGWVHIWAIAGDLPWPANMSDGIADIVRTTDFLSLVRREPTLGGFALQSAAAAAAHHPDPALQRRVREMILAIARALEERFPHPTVDVFDHEGPVPTAPFLMQAAVELAKRPGSRAAVLAEFTELLNELISTWPALAQAIGPFSQRAWEELSPGEAHFFGNVVVRARALA